MKKRLLISWYWALAFLSIPTSPIWFMVWLTTGKSVWLWLFEKFDC